MGVGGTETAGGSNQSVSQGNNGQRNQGADAANIFQDMLAQSAAGASGNGPMSEAEADAIMNELQAWKPGQREIAAANRAKGLPDWYRTDAQLAEIKRQVETIDKLRSLNGALIYGSQENGPENAYIAEGLALDSRQLSLMAHAKGDLMFLLEINKRHGERVTLDEKKKQEWNDSHGFVDKLVTSYEKEKAYYAKKEEHPDWEVKPNLLLDLIDPIVKETPHVSGTLWLIFAGGLGTAKVPPARGLLPAGSAAADASQILSKLGASADDLAAFAKGEKIWIFKTENGISTTSYFQFTGGKLTAGVLSIKNPATASLSTVRALKSFLDQSSNLAKSLKAKTLRLEGNAVTNLGTKGMEGLLDRMGFKVDPKDPGLTVRETKVK